MKVCDYNHLLLYAKNHYKRNKDVIADVKVILAHRCGLERGKVSDEDTWAMCCHALLTYDHEHVDRFLGELFKPMFDEHGQPFKWFSNTCPLSRAVKLVLIHLSRVRVLDADGNRILELGDPDPAILEVSNVVRCEDNEGVEDKFDKGIDYVCADHSHPMMIYVYDKFGEKQECFRSRFKKLGPVREEVVT